MFVHPESCNWSRIHIYVPELREVKEKSDIEKNAKKTLGRNHISKKKTLPERLSKIKKFISFF